MRMAPLLKKKPGEPVKGEKILAFKNLGDPWFESIVC
jgi:hypothetical protein